VKGGALALVLTMATISALAASAAAAPTSSTASPIELVVDTSDSMNESDGSAGGRIKIDGAKVALLDFLQQVEPDTALGLRTYPGPQEGQIEGCSTGGQRFPIAPRDPADMAATIRTMRADGDTPTAAALSAAAEDLRQTGTDQATIVLVSDGESNCGANPCDTAREIAESGIDLQTITVGFRVSGAGAKELQCIADQTGGKYLSVHDNAGLAEAFDEISRPQIHLTVHYPPEVTAQVGNDPSGLVRIEAEATNTGQRLALDVVARIRFDVAAGAPAVIRPVVFLGNLEPGESRQLAWSFRPGVPLDKGSYSVPFSVLAGAENTLADTEFGAAIKVRDAYYSAKDAGPILSSRKRIVIAGDSYSAGEGGDAYLPGTDTDANACHRSPHTYLVQIFNLPDRNIVACSGAVVNDIAFPQGGRTVPSQLEQLESLRDGGGINAVVLTLGGNDLGFAAIGESCLIGRSDCSDRIYTNVPLPQTHSEDSDEFVQMRLAGLPHALESAYREINWVVNGQAARDRGLGPVPIIVLGYPLPTPLTPRDCPEMQNLLSANEIDFLDELGLKLNGAAEGAVESARQGGVPVFYVPNTEMALQPDHTVCDRNSYARTIYSFNGAGPNPAASAQSFDPGFWARVKRLNPVQVIKNKVGEIGAGKRRFERGLQELLHPNQAGYAAMSRAVLRWSQSPDAMAALAFLDTSPTATKPPSLPVVSADGGLGQLAPGSAPTLQSGGSYQLDLQGFAPGSTVVVGVHSDYRVLSSVTADAGGTVSTAVGIPPDLGSGDHTLTVVGGGDEGKPRRVEIPFHVAGGGPPGAVELLAGIAVSGVVLSALLALALLVARRRQPGTAAG
jgi:von Willebrand factor type A domain/GDSL-like Lipase/Acylhydrolase family